MGQGYVSSNESALWEFFMFQNLSFKAVEVSKSIKYVL